MAQLVFDPITGGITTIDSQTVLTMQSYLDTGDTITTETVPTLDDEDVFQCGKCKKQFTSLNVFMNHKKEQCLSINTENGQESSFTSSPCTPGSLLVVKSLNQNTSPNFTVSSTANKQASPLGSLVLSETDLLSLALDGSASVPSLLTSSASVLHGTSPKSCERFGNQGLSCQAQGLSLLSNGLLSSSGLLLTSQGNGTGGTNLVLTISNPPVIGKEETIPGETDVTKVSVTTSKTSDEKKNRMENSSTDLSSNICKPKRKLPAKMTCRTSNNSDLGPDEQVTKKGIAKTTQSQKMKCTFCDKSFSKNFDLQQHVRCHTGEKPFQCIICGRAFAQKSNVKKHIQTHKVWPDGLYSTLPCSVSNGNKCTSETQSPPDVAATTTTSITSTTTTTTTTTTTSTTATPISNIPDEEVELENTSPKVDNSYVCPYCQYFGKTYFDLKGHMKEHKNRKVFKCILSTCAKMYEDLDAFLDHVKSHESEITYHCHLCPKKFQSLYDLGVHQYSHSLYPNKTTNKFKKTFRCSTCLNKYSTATALDHHMATCSHNYPCPQCNKSFPCERYLRRHLLVHSNRSGFICPICSKSFKAEHYLRIHKLIHTGEKPFTCPHCETSFNRNDKLKRHLLIHEPLKRFKCPFRNHSGCLKEFNRPDKLKAHVLTHGQSKPFFCKTCGRSFTRRTQFNAHQIQHEEEKDYPFQCSKCGSGFLNQEIFDSHVCVQYPPRKWRADARYQRSARLRRSKFNLLRPRKKLRKTVSEEDVLPEETLLEDDGIPTAHIEIISTTGDLSQVSELSQISLQLHPLVEVANKETVNGTVIQNFPLVTSKDSSVYNYELQEIIPIKLANCAELCQDDAIAESGVTDS